MFKAQAHKSAPFGVAMTGGGQPVHGVNKKKGLMIYMQVHWVFSKAIIRNEYGQHCIRI